MRQNIRHDTKLTYFYIIKKKNKSQIYNYNKINKYRISTPNHTLFI